MELHKIRALLNNGESIFTLPLRVAAYARVSSDKEEQINSLGNQIQYYEEYIKKNPKWVFAGIYIDEGLTASKNIKKRERFLQMIADGKAGAFDLIITKEISRFARNTLDSISYTQELLKHGIGVYFQSDNINTLLPDAELRLTIMSGIAQDEVRKLSERVRFGFKQAVKNGRVLGRDNIRGYDKKDGKLTIDEKGAEEVRYIFHTYVEGRFGLRRIARELEKRGVVGENGKMLCFESIRAVIKNPKYKGSYCGGKYATLDYQRDSTVLLDESEWIVHPDPNIPVIVSEEVWDTANRLLVERGKRFQEHSAAYSNRYTYSGKLFCAEHGTSYHRHVYKSKRGDKECWNCGMYRLKGKKEGCDSPTIYTSELNDIMASIYKKIYDNREAVLSSLLTIYQSVDDTADYKKEIRKIQERINAVKQKKDKLLELTIEGLIDRSEFTERNTGFNAELEEQRQQLERIKAEQVSRLTTRKQFEDLKNVLEQEWSDEDTEEFTSIILDRIIVTKLDSNSHIKLDIQLKTGQSINAGYERVRNQAIPEYSIALYDMGISLSAMHSFTRRISGAGKGTYQAFYSTDIKICC
jgi:site-specific DNA recombinase